jgi:hypothetical protein
MLAVEDGPASFAGLASALIEEGERLGWLDLAPVAEPLSVGLEEAAAIGVLRSVAVSPSRVSTVKPIRGEVVLDDLLREHFRGCRLVLVRGGAGLVRLAADATCWRLTAPDGTVRERTLSELVADLRRPSLWRRLTADRGGSSD